MKCPRCQAGTMVYDTRQTRTNTVRRRRECTICSHRFTTWESTVNQPRLVEQRRAALRSLRARLTPEQRKARVQLDHMRRAAREEARRTGEDVKLIYARWGCELPGG